MEHVCCIFCDASVTRTYAEENGHRAVQCQGCGLVFVDPRPSIDEMRRLYDGQETKVDIAKHIRARDTKTEEARRMLDVIRALRPGGGRLLEIGSAAGYTLREARAQGFDVQGVELTPTLARFAVRNHGVSVFEGTLREASLPEASFDVVLHRNVLSHLAWPLDEHRILHRLLRPGGHLVFETGNVADLPAAAAGELELPDHLFHFSERTLGLLLERSGFRHLTTRRHVLLDQLPWTRALLHAARPTQATSRRPNPIPATMPASTPTGRIMARAHQFLRYDVGARLRSTARRCTLVVSAQRVP